MLTGWGWGEPDCPGTRLPRGPSSSSRWRPAHPNPSPDPHPRARSVQPGQSPERPHQGKGRGFPVYRGSGSRKELEGASLSPRAASQGPLGLCPAQLFQWGRGEGDAPPLDSVSDDTALQGLRRNTSAVLEGPDLPESSPVPSTAHRTCQNDLFSGCKSLLNEENLLTVQFFC